MRIIDTQGRQFRPAFIADVPSGNLVWVDPVNGNNDMAVRGRMTVPFKTLTKAKTAAASGDTIVVLPGEYNEKDLLKNGVNSSNPTLTIIGARINSLYANSAGHSIYIAAGGSDKIKLAGCVLLCTDSANSINVPAGGSTIQFHGLSIGRKVTSGGTLTAVPTDGWKAPFAVT